MYKSQFTFSDRDLSLKWVKSSGNTPATIDSTFEEIKNRDHDNLLLFLEHTFGRIELDVTRFLV